MPLTSVQYSNSHGNGKWLQIDQEVETRNGRTVGTSHPTGHSLLADVHFELPYGWFLNYFSFDLIKTRIDAIRLINYCLFRYILKFFSMLYV